MNYFKLGLCSVTFRKKSAEEVVALAQKAGIEFIEWGSDVHVKNLADAKKVKALCEDASIKISSYGSYFNSAEYDAMIKALNVVMTWPQGGKDAAKFSTMDDVLKNVIGYVPQDDIVFSNLTLNDMLKYAAALRMPDDTTIAEKEARKAEKLSKGERKSLIFMLGGLFFLFCGTNAITTFFALFAAEVLGKTTSEATIMTTLFAVCSAAAAIPAGKMGKKLGRKKTILIGLVVFMAVFLLYVVTNSMAVIWLALILGGAANMLITVNTLPLVLEIGGIDKVGTFTGYYYTATFSAQIASPIVYGFIRMFAGTYMSLFYYSPIMFLLAVIMIAFVKHGEAEIPDEVIEAAAQDD